MAEDGPKRHFMNPAHGRHMGGQSAEPSKDVKQESGQHHPPHIHIHHDGAKTHVHIMHHDQSPERHEHDSSDVEGIKSHIDEHYGQDHGGDNEGGDGEDDLLSELG